jgi:hypothetical protein
LRHGRSSGLCILKDHFRAFFADHDRGCVGIAGNDRRHDRGIDHPQARKATYVQPLIDHGILILAHAAAADGMIGGGTAAADEIKQIIVVIALLPRLDLLGDMGAPWQAPERCGAAP